MESVLKNWLKQGNEPRDFYELMNCRRLETRQDILLDAIEQANEFFFQCQEHGDSFARQKARQYQRQLAEARQILTDRARWTRYDEGVVEQILREFDQCVETHGTPTDEEIQVWLAEIQSVAGQQLLTIYDRVKQRMPQEVGLLEIDEFVETESAIIEVAEESSTHKVKDIPTLSSTNTALPPLPPPTKPVGNKAVPPRAVPQPEPPPPESPVSLPKQTAQFTPGLKRQYTIVGIDLGTTYSAIAYVDHHGKAQVVCNPEDQQRPIMPSAIFFEEGEALIGQAALDNAYVEPSNVVQFAKRSLGERRTFEVAGQSFTPETISALILKKLVQYAEPSIGEVHRVVITVPAFFNEKRRAATVQCGEIAGLKVEATLNEPSAALIGYGLHNDPDLDGTDSRGKPLVKNYVVYDLGGGTFDVTVMEVSQNRVKELATGGNRELGGLDWDQALVDYVAAEFQAQHGCSPKDTDESLQALMALCTNAKIQLTTRKRTAVMCTHAGRAHRVEITREKFEQLTAAMLAMTELTVETCLRDAGLSWDDVQDVLMVGGSTIMPMVKGMLTRIAGRPPRSDIDPSTVVAQGAALYAGVLETQGAIRGASEHQGADEPQVDSRPPQMLPSPRSAGFVVEQLPSHNGDDLELALDLQLVNSHGVGVYATKQGEAVNVVMIPRNSKLPTSRVQLFRTTRNGLQELRVRVSEGDSNERASCDLLGTCVLGPLPGGLPRGTPVKLEIGFSKEGRVQVTADCQGKRVGAEIEAQALLTEVQMKEEQRRVIEMTSHY